MKFSKKITHKNLDDMFRLIHSVSLGTSPTNHIPTFFSSSQVLKNLISPPKQRKSPNNPNLLQIFDNNIYTDFGTAYKHVLNPTYIIQMI